MLALAFGLLAGCRPADRVVVGSKNFSEQVLLGEIVAQSIERRANVPVQRRLGLGGTFVCDHALRAGEIDVYVEYTGTAFTAILKRAPISDRARVLAEVRNTYAESAIEWTNPLGFENAFALVVRGEDSERLGVRKISDLAAHPDWRAAFGYEFMERADGFAGLARTYGLRFDQQPRTLDLGLLYRALVDHQADVAATVALPRTARRAECADGVYLHCQRHRQGAGQPRCLCVGECGSARSSVRPGLRARSER